MARAETSPRTCASDHERSSNVKVAPDPASVVEITLLLNRFVLSIDQRQYDRLRSCLADEVMFDYSATNVAMPTNANDLVAFLRNRHSQYESLQHLTSNFLVSGDETYDAVCTANFVARHVYPESNRRVDWSIGGRYHYGLICRDNAWLIKSSKIEPVWFEYSSGSRHAPPT